MGDSHPDRVDPDELDLVLAAVFAGWAMTEETRRRIAADGHPDLRAADGSVFQHLIEGPKTATELSALLGVSQQAASKRVGELERRGYLTRDPDPADARARRIGLTPRGERAVEAGRRHRRELEAELADRLGARRAENTRRALIEVIAELGADEAIASRRIRPPR